MKKAFSLTELAIVILIIGIMITGVTQASRMIAASRLQSGQSLTQSSPVAGIKGLTAWFETTLDKSFNSNEAIDGADIFTWYDINPTSVTKYNLISDVVTPDPESDEPVYETDVANNLPMVKFDGIDDYLIGNSADGNIIPSLYTSPMTIFVVSKPTFSPLQALLKVIFSFHSSGSTNRLIVGFSALTDTITMTGTTAFNTNYATTIHDKATIMGFKFRGSSDEDVDYFLNGTLFTTAAGVDQVSAAARFSVGQEWDGAADASDYFTGYIGEIIIYNRALSAAEITDVSRYLGKKWGVIIS
jgi:prepilin-type N-terminal cleavage/methylation domain-containing protein